MKKRLIAIVMTLVVLGVCGMSSLACTKGYSTSTVDVFRGSNTDTATSTIYRCDCHPVRNSLKAEVRCQYNVGNDFIWDPVEPYFYYTEGNNVRTQTISVSQPNITYAQGYFEAECNGDGLVRWFQDADYH